MKVMCTLCFKGHIAAHSHTCVVVQNRKPRTETFETDYAFLGLLVSKFFISVLKDGNFRHFVVGYRHKIHQCLVLRNIRAFLMWWFIDDVRSSNVHPLFSSQSSNLILLDVQRCSVYSHTFLAFFEVACVRLRRLTHTPATEAERAQSLCGPSCCHTTSSNLRGRAVLTHAHMLTQDIDGMFAVKPITKIPETRPGHSCMCQWSQMAC